MSLNSKKLRKRIIFLHKYRIPMHVNSRNRGPFPVMPRELRKAIDDFKKNIKKERVQKSQWRQLELWPK